MSSIRPAAVAGMFYPADAARARRRRCAACSPRPKPTIGPRRRPVGRPKAIIAPHAGYVYSGPVAASAYALPGAAAPRRSAASSSSARRTGCGSTASRCSAADAFATPLGPVPVDTAAVAEIAALPQVARLEPPHADEHCLEVHLPFLQEVLGTFAIVPMVVGNASGEQVAEVLERLWGGARDADRRQLRPQPLPRLRRAPRGSTRRRRGPSRRWRRPRSATSRPAAASPWPGC